MIHATNDLSFISIKCDKHPYFAIKLNNSTILSLFFIDNTYSPGSEEGLFVSRGHLHKYSLARIKLLHPLTHGHYQILLYSYVTKQDQQINVGEFILWFLALGLA